MRLTETILAALEAVREAGKVAAVAYNSPQKVNVDFDAIASPAAVLYLFRDGAYDTESGLLRELADVNVLFLTHQPQLDFNGSANEALLDDMADAAAMFIAELTASGSVEFVGGEVTLRGVYDFNDKNTTGVSLQFRLRELKGRCLNSLRQ